MPSPAPLPSENYAALMRRCIADAQRASDEGEIPVAALVIDEAGVIVAEGRNERQSSGDPTAHAEILALRRAGLQKGDWHLGECTLLVTLEPCLMCAGAILAARIPRLVFGTWDEKAGAAGSVFDVLRDRRLNHQVEVIAGVEREACSAQLVEFFRAQR